jgi:hypothetical protein
VAVGSQGDSAHLSRGDVPLTMIWNGKSWRKTVVPLPRGVPQGELNGVSCRSAAYCVAFGDDFKGSAYSPIAETWNGGSWTVAALPRPAGGFFVRSNAVSCAAVGRCVAVGLNLTRSQTALPFMETLSGRTWTLRAVPLPKGGTGGVLSGVACLSVANCVLAGSYEAAHPSVLFESWNGKAFTLMKAASPSRGAPAVNSVSCVSAKHCVAVGTLAGAATLANDGFAEVWNGSAWSATVMTGPKAPPNAILTGVSCASATSCLAVGVTSSNGSQQNSHAIAVSYDGHSWTTVSVPAEPGFGPTDFNGVSCHSATDCLAVGEMGKPRGALFSNAAFTGVWNGKTWKLVPAF